MNETHRTEIATLGEFGLIEHLTSGIAPVNAETLTGVGDDAAILAFKEEIDTTLTLINRNICCFLRTINLD